MTTSPALFRICLPAAIAVVVGGGWLAARVGAAGTEPTATASAVQKTGVLLVSHGSRSERWRNMLLDVEHRVRDRVLAAGDVHGLRSAFMEYTEPSIATRMKEFDAEGYTDVVLVPLLLTVSAHSFDDIPTIYGGKRDALSAAELRSEGIELYDAKCRVHMTPLLDFPAMLEANVVRRAQKLSRDAAAEGVVLVAYGDAGYEREWQRVVERLATALQRDASLAPTTHAWCGHLVHYAPAPTTEAIARVLAVRERALVIPLLVSIDEMFQHKIIGGAVRDAGASDRIVYVPDAILPDPGVDEWVVDIVRETRRRLPPEGARK